MNKFNNQNGVIFNIQRFSIHDGHGIRTLIFMKGCPLKCVWCCNPESQSFSEEILFVMKNCIGCGNCSKACPQKAIDPISIELDRHLCTACGICTRTCYANARKITGKRVTVDEIISEIEKDRIFYRNSQGGVTVGGGEPSSQPDFVASLLKECKRLNIHTAVETCGYGPWDKIKTVYEYSDQIFFDLKHMNAEEHIRLTGVSNSLILDNAKRVSSLNKEIIFRIPLIPNSNDNEQNILDTGKFVKSLMTLSNNIKIELLPYHGLGSDKYAWMDKEYALSHIKTPGTEIKQNYNNLLRCCGCNIIG